MTSNIMRNLAGFTFKIAFLLLFVLMTSVTENEYIYWVGFALFALLCVSKTNRIAFVVSLALFYLLYNLDLLEFTLFQQAMDIMGTNAYELLKALHPHIFRYIIVYPALLVHRLTAQSVHTAYSLYCLVLLSGIFVVMRNINCILHNRKRKLINVVCFVMLAITAFFMNGRIIPAFLGILILIEYFCRLFDLSQDGKISRINAYDISKILFGFLLTTVSSGTMIVSFLLICICLVIIYCIQKKPMLTVPVVIMLAGWLLFTLCFIAFMTYRNLAYYRNSIVGLLGHGLGGVFSQYILVLVALFLAVPVIFIALSTLLYWSYNHCRALIPVVLTIPFAAICGLFGISTATMAIPALIVLLLFPMPTITYMNKPNDAKGVARNGTILYYK